MLVHGIRAAQMQLHWMNRQPGVVVVSPLAEQPLNTPAETAFFCAEPVMPREPAIAELIRVSRRPVVDVARIFFANVRGRMAFSPATGGIT
jgi:hypothetical protein